MHIISPPVVKLFDRRKGGEANNRTLRNRAMRHCPIENYLLCPIGQITLFKFKKFSLIVFRSVTVWR